MLTMGLQCVEAFFGASHLPPLALEYSHSAGQRAVGQPGSTSQVPSQLCFLATSQPSTANKLSQCEAELVGLLHVPPRSAV